MGQVYGGLDCCCKLTKGEKPLHALSMQEFRKVRNDFNNFVHGNLGGRYHDVENEKDCECELDNNILCVEMRDMMYD
jgi:hypothetical protein